MLGLQPPDVQRVLVLLAGGVAVAQPAAQSPQLWWRVSFFIVTNIISACASGQCSTTVATTVVGSHGRQDVMEGERSMTSTSRGGRTFFDINEGCESRGG